MGHTTRENEFVSHALILSRASINDVVSVCVLNRTRKSLFESERGTLNRLIPFRFPAVTLPLAKYDTKCCIKTNNAICQRRAFRIGDVGRADAPSPTNLSQHTKLRGVS